MVGDFYRSCLPRPVFETLPVLGLLGMFGAPAQLDGSFQVVELWVCVADLVQICPTILVVFFSTWGGTGAIPCQVVGGVPSCWWDQQGKSGVRTHRRETRSF